MAKPKPWPRYTGNLKTALEPGADLTVEIPERLASACKLYGIDQGDPLWERRLLMTLLHRHLGGFQITPKPQPRVDEAFIIDTIDALKDFHEQDKGVRPSTDAVVQEIVEAPREDNAPFVKLSHSRLMRIYAGRREYVRRLHKEAHEVLPKKLAQAVEASLAVQQVPEDSHARLLLEVYRGRAA